MIILYKIFLDIVYYFVISPLFSYEGMIVVFHGVWMRMILSYIATFLLSRITPKEHNRLTYVLFNIELIIMIIPMLSFYAFASQNIIYMISVICVYILQLSVHKLLLKRRPIAFKSQYFRCLVKVILLGILATGCIATVIYARPPSLDAMNFDNIYTIRERTQLPYWAGYFVSWCTNIVIPYLLCLGLLKHNWTLTAFSIVLQFLFYLIFAHKAILFTIPLLLFIYYISRFKKFHLYFIAGLIMGLFVSMCAYLSGQTRPITILADRLLFIPAQIKFAYYSFFADNIKVCFADGIIGKLFHLQSPYEYTIPEQISIYLYNAAVPFNANTGYLGDAYANGGMIGLICIALLVLIYSYMLDCVSLRVNKRLTTPIIFQHLMVLNDGAFFTICLTGGGWLIFLILLSLNKKD